MRLHFVKLLLFRLLLSLYFLHKIISFLSYAVYKFHICPFSPENMDCIILFYILTPKNSKAFPPFLSNHPTCLSLWLIPTTINLINILPDTRIKCINEWHYKFFFLCFFLQIDLQKFTFLTL